MYFSVKYTNNLNIFEGYKIYLNNAKVFCISSDKCIVRRERHIHTRRYQMLNELLARIIEEGLTQTQKEKLAAIKALKDSAKKD